MDHQRHSPDFDASGWAAAAVVPAEDAPRGRLTEQLQPAVKVVIRPCLPEGMSEFDCAYRSVKGEIRVRVKLDGDEVRLSVTAPEAVDCRVDASNLQFEGRTVIVRR